MLELSLERSSSTHQTTWLTSRLKLTPWLTSGYDSLSYLIYFICCNISQTIKAFVPAMIKNNHGHVITVASGAGLFGVAGLVDYCASKFGAVGIHESLTSELSIMGKDGVHTTVVCPFFIDTGMFDGVKSR